MRAIPDEVTAGLLRDGAELTLVGRGRSMWPVISPGDRVVAGRGTPRPGDIVLLRTDAGIVTHRLVAVLTDPARLVARGDWLDDDDAPVAHEDLLGVVHRIVKGRLIVDLRTRRGALLQRALFRVGRLLKTPWVRRVGRALCCGGREA